ncbi:unnamed protein product [Schistosoma margrebowiei]|uniref:Uncharacterized protein n=1 Tax=Schistosoma margrebowiei TaxID=48269 RepID=A0A183MBK3_9TREM|nr:unnamed protein product [Schistosoma margrebowiei]
MLHSNNHRQKKCILTETPINIQERKNKKTAIDYKRTRTENVKVQAKNTEANEQVKKSIRADKQKYMEELETTTEKLQKEEI